MAAFSDSAFSIAAFSQNAFDFGALASVSSIQKPYALKGVLIKDQSAFVVQLSRPLFFQVCLDRGDIFIARDLHD